MVIGHQVGKLHTGGGGGDLLPRPYQILKAQPIYG